MLAQYARKASVPHTFSGAAAAPTACTFESGRVLVFQTHPPGRRGGRHHVPLRGTWTTCIRNWRAMPPICVAVTLPVSGGGVRPSLHAAKALQRTAAEAGPPGAMIASSRNYDLHLPQPKQGRDRNADRGVQHDVAQIFGANARADGLEWATQGRQRTGRGSHAIKERLPGEHEPLDPHAHNVILG